MIPFGIGRPTADTTTGLHVRRNGTHSFAVYNGGERISEDIRPAERFQYLVKKYPDQGRGDDVPAQDMQLEIKGKGCRLLVVYRLIYGNRNQRDQVDNYDGMVLLKWE